VAWLGASPGASAVASPGSAERLASATRPPSAGNGGATLVPGDGDGDAAVLHADASASTSHAEGRRTPSFYLLPIGGARRYRRGMSKRTDGDRLTDLELRYMKLERLVDELSDVVATQQRSLDRLGAELARAIARLHDLGERSEGPIPDEKPPHY